VNIGAISRFFRNASAFTRADHYGATVAHDELLAAVLNYHQGASAYLFNPILPIDGSVLAPQWKSGEDLVRTFGTSRIHIEPFTALQTIADRRKFVFLTGGPDLNQIAQLRSSIPTQHFPICTILHSVAWTPLLSAYLSFAMLSDANDVLVATSECGRLAVEEVIYQTNECIKRKFGGGNENSAAPARVVTIPLGTDLPVLDPHTRVSLRREWGIPIDATVLLYLGRLTEQFKADLEPLILVFERLASERPNTFLIIAGQDVQETYGRLLGGYASALGLENRMRVITNFPFADKKNLYSMADVFVSPVDNVQETFGLAIVEAMAAGLPVVASNWSGYRDLVVDGETGFLVKTLWNDAAGDVASAYQAALVSRHSEHYLAQQTVVDTSILYSRLKLLIDDPELRCRLGNGARARVEAHYTWRDVSSRFVDLWEEQLTRTERVTATKCGRHTIDYNATFRHYAAELLDAAVAIALNEEPSALRRAFIVNRIRLLPATPFKAEVIRILDRCRGGPVALGDLEKCGNGSTRAAFVWLLKKGYCRCMSEAKHGDSMY